MGTMVVEYNAHHVIHHVNYVPVVQLIIVKDVQRLANEPLI